jgi:hypothetical protein
MRDFLCRMFLTSVMPRLRMGARHGWGRAALALVLVPLRRQWALFYTVQGPADEKRLRNNGEPWPTEETRSHFGAGVYAWKHLRDAREYRQMLLRRFSPRSPHADLCILRFAILRRRLRSFRSIDVNSLADPDGWMDRYSLLGHGPVQDHGADYIQRQTGAVRRGTKTAIEHFFSKSVFRYLHFFEGWTGGK